MKRRSTLLFFLVATLLFGVTAIAVAIAIPEVRNQIFNTAATNTIDLYVDFRGNDSADGSIGNPLASFEGAKAKVSQLRAADTDINIYFRGGTYIVDETIEFGPLDSGIGGTITYSSYPGEDVYLTGSDSITSWTSVGNGIWETPAAPFLDSSGDIRQLYYDGNWISSSYYLGRTGSNYLTVSAVDTTDTLITFDESLPNIGNHAEYVNFTKWTETIVPVSETNGATIRLSTLGRIFGQDTWQRIIPGMKGYLQNVPIEVTTATENVWQHDKDRGVIRLRLVDGSNPNSGGVNIPTNQQMFKFSKAENITLKGFYIEHLSGWELPTTTDNRRGYFGYQAGVHIEQTVPRVADIMTPGVLVEGSKNIEISHNSFKNISGPGLAVRLQSSDIRIAYNDFDQIGQGCIYIGDSYVGTGSADVLYTSSSEVTHDVDVINNNITRCGRISFAGVGIWQANSNNVLIKQNSVTDQPYSGISSGWVWGAAESVHRNIDIQNNYVANVMRVNLDGGGIYTLGNSPDSEVSGNLLVGMGTNRIVPAESSAQGAPAMGLYFDNSSRGRSIFNNIVYDVMDPDYVIFFQPLGDGSGPEYNSLGRNWLLEEGYPQNIVAAAGVQGRTGPKSLVALDVKPELFSIAEFRPGGGQDLVVYDTVQTDSGMVDVLGYTAQSEYGVIANEVSIELVQGDDYFIDVVPYDYLDGDYAIVAIKHSSTPSGFVEVYGFEGPDYDKSWEVVTSLPVGEYLFDIYDFGNGSGYDIVVVDTDTTSGNLELSLLSQLQGTEASRYKTPYYTTELPFPDSGLYSFEIQQFATNHDLVVYQASGSNTVVNILSQLDTVFNGSAVAGEYKQVYWDKQIPYNLATTYFEVAEFISGQFDLAVVKYDDTDSGKVEVDILKQSDFYDSILWDTTLDLNSQ